MKFLLMIAVILSMIKMILNKCIDIDTPTITNYFNQTYNNDCYDHTIQTIDDCCENFIINNNCENMYTHCINYNHFVIDNIHTGCHIHNESIFDISYTDYCHQFVLQIDPFCCKNITNCLGWYTNCATNYTHNNHSCVIPTKYTSDWCSNYTINIDPNCCDYFNNHCSQIYNWCIQNSPTHVSIFDLFLPSQIGMSIGSTLITYSNTPTLIECLQMCLSNVICKSINYVNNLKYCNLNRYKIGDLIDGNIVSLLDDPNSIYLEKKLSMPYHNTYCNIKNPSFIGDGFCDKKGGYNLQVCNYDGGDCCKDTCLLNDFTLFCGFNGYNCLDPNVLNPPTYSPSIPPTSHPTYSPTFYPTSIPTTNSPTSIPTTNSPTSTPTTNSPTSTPTTNSPTIYPTSFPTTNTPTTNTPTSEPTSEPTTSEPMRNEQRSEIEESEGYKKTITVLIILVIILSLFSISGLIVYCKHKHNANKVFNLQKQQQTNMIISNPMYDKEPTKIDKYNSDSNISNISNGIYEDEYNTYEDDNYDDVEYTHESEMVDGYVTD